MPAPAISPPLPLKALLDSLRLLSTPLHTAVRRLLAVSGLAPGDVSCFVEQHYIDENFSDEYEAYYCKLLKHPPKHCTRLHFFDISSDRARTGLDDLGEAPESYLGFMTLRPWFKMLVNAAGEAAFEVSPGKENRLIVNCIWNPLNKNKQGIRLPQLVSHNVHLGKYTLVARGIPYVQQDAKVGACAQAAIWTADKVMHSNFATRRHSISQITRLAKAAVAYGRVIPSHDGKENGLQAQQMLSALVQMGLEPLYYSWDAKALRFITPKGKPAELLPLLWHTLYSYVRSGIPVILLGKVNEGWHAVTAIGTCDRPTAVHDPFARAFSGLVFHDDQYGPYVLTPAWSRDNNLLRYPEKQVFQIQNMIVPLPGKVFMTAIDAKWSFDTFEQLRSEASQNGTPFQLKREETLGGTKFRRLSIVKSGTYRERVQTLTAAGRFPALFQDAISRLELPRYIWVGEYCSASQQGTKVYGTLILDATAEYQDGGIYWQLFEAARLLGETEADDETLTLATLFEPYDSPLA